MPSPKGSLISGALLISGTTIGAGMLALPFVTGVAGFGPAMAINTVCWLFMLCTGLLFLEVTLWMPEGSNLLSMSRHFLGRWGWAIAGIAFLFLYYCLLVAYFSGGVPILIEGLEQVHMTIAPGWGYFGVALIFGLILFAGSSAIGRINLILMGGLILSYLTLIAMGSADVVSDRLEQSNWSLGLLAAPTLFSAYGYHNIIPSVTTYLRRDEKRMRYAIVLGTLLPFLVYSSWQWLVIGALPQSLIQETVESGKTITHALALASHNPWMVMVGRYFSLFAIITSLLGVAFSMIDFIGDGTKIPRHGWGRVLLCLIVIAPPALLSANVPGLFFSALHYAGGFGEAILNGFFPIALVWVGRYWHHLHSRHILRGGRLSLSLLMLITLIIVGYETYFVAMGG